MHLFHCRLREIDYWRDLSISVSNSGYEEHHNPNRPTDAPFVRCLEKIDEIQQSVEDKVAYLVELKEEINAAIDKLENRDEQLLLRYRYLDDWQLGGNIPYDEHIHSVGASHPRIRFYRILWSQTESWHTLAQFGTSWHTCHMVLL